MKKLLLAAAFVALGTGAAMAFGPNPSDADPPGALFASKPGGTDHVPRAITEMRPRWNAAARPGTMTTAPVGLRTAPVR